MRFWNRSFFYFVYIKKNFEYEKKNIEKNINYLKCRMGYSALHFRHTNKKHTYAIPNKLSTSLDMVR